MTHDRVPPAARVAVMLWCVAGVPLVVMLLIRLIFGESLTSFRPYLNDEVAYWHQALTFSRAGFDGGYYTLNEVTNASGLTPFGPHGPVFAVLYGSFGAVLGWHLHSSVVLNLALIAAAAWAYVALAAPTTARGFLFGGLLVTFWPLILWAPTGMQEGLHGAGAIAMAGLFARTLRQPSTGVTIAGWAMLAALGLLRPSWLVLLPIWGLVSTWTRRPVTRAASLAGSFGLAGALLLVYTSTTAPFPTGFFFLQAVTLEAGMRNVIDNLALNVAMLTGDRDFNPLETLHRLEYAGWMAAATVLAAVGFRRRASAPWAGHLLVGAAAGVGALILLLALYAVTNWADHRVLSAFLLFAAALAAAAPGRPGVLLPAALMLTNLVTLPMFVSNFAELRRDNFVWDRRGHRQFTEAIEGTVVYRDGQPRWCNTLLTSQYPPYLAGVPGGVGISVTREADQVALPPRSKYLLLDDTAVAELRRPVRMTEITRLPYGSLYLNEESGCE